MRSCQHDEHPMPVRILEVGLGLGVNALLTAQQAAHYGVPVEYVGIEHDFQSVEVIRKVLAPFPDELVLAFCNAVEELKAEKSITDEKMTANVLTTPTRLNSQFQLQIIPTDITVALETLLHNNTERIDTSFDAVYLDAFSPDSNPECWTADILAKLGKTLAPNGRLTTYCAKGSVRRAMQAAGFKVTRRPGPPGKRECLMACF